MLTIESKTLTNDQVIKILEIIATAKPERINYIFAILKEYGFNLEFVEEKLNSNNCNYKENFAKKVSVEEGRKKRGESIEIAFEAIAEKGVCSVNKLAEFLNCTPQTTRNRIRCSDNLSFEDGLVFKD